MKVFAQSLGPVSLAAGILALGGCAPIDARHQGSSVGYAGGEPAKSHLLAVLEALRPVLRDLGTTAWNAPVCEKLGLDAHLDSRAEQLALSRPASACRARLAASGSYLLRRLDAQGAHFEFADSLPGAAVALSDGHLDGRIRFDRDAVLALGSWTERCVLVLTEEWSPVVGGDAGLSEQMAVAVCNFGLSRSAHRTAAPGVRAVVDLHTVWSLEKPSKPIQDVLGAELVAEEPGTEVVLAMAYGGSVELRSSTGRFLRKDSGLGADHVRALRAPAQSARVLLRASEAATPNGTFINIYYAMANDLFWRGTRWRGYSRWYSPPLAADSGRDWIVRAGTDGALQSFDVFGETAYGCAVASSHQRWALVEKALQFPNRTSPATVLSFDGPAGTGARLSGACLTKNGVLSNYFNEPLTVDFTHFVATPLEIPATAFSGLAGSVAGIGLVKGTGKIAALDNVGAVFRSSNAKIANVKDLAQVRNPFVPEREALPSLLAVLSEGGVLSFVDYGGAVRARIPVEPTLNRVQALDLNGDGEIGELLLWEDGSPGS